MKLTDNYYDYSEKQLSKKTSSLDDVSEIEHAEARARYKYFYDYAEEFSDYVEAFLALETWSLYSQAFPLVLGISPDDWHLLKGVNTKGLREQIDASIYVSIKVLNPNEERNFWRVNRCDFIKWIHKNAIYQSPAFELTTHFKSNKVRVKNKPHGNTVNNSVIREQIYKAAVSVLANYPKDCTHGKNISASKVARIIYDKSPILFNNDEIGMELNSMEKIIREAINMLQ